MILSSRRWGPLPAVDAVIFVVLFGAAFGLCRHAANWPLATYHASSNQDIWFDADTKRVFELSADRASNNFRAELHPLERLTTYPPVFVLRKFMAMRTEEAVHAFHSAVSALWLAAFYLLLRRMGLRRIDALAFDAVLGTSATALFWMPVTEIFVAGSLTMFPALAIAARPDLARPVHHYVAAVASLGLTVTNAMAAGFASLVTLRRGRFLAITAMAIATVVLGALLEKATFQVTQVVLKDPSIEAAWIFSPGSGGPAAIFRTFFLTGMVAPEFSFQHNWLHGAWPFLTFQYSLPFTGSAWSWIALPAWLAVLGLGAWGMLRDRARPALRSVLTLLILYQLLLHLVYGRETFLYAAHYVTLLVMVAAFASLTRFRRAALALCAVLVITNTLNNVPLVTWAKGYAGRHAALKKVEGRIPLPDMGKPKMDEAVDFRFWRDLR